MFAALNAFQVGGSTPTYVSDVFSTALYAGNSSSQTITNGINLSSKGGLVWLKNRTSSLSSNFIFDNARNNYDAWIFTDSTVAQSVVDAIDPTSSGFSINIGGSGVNASSNNYVSWTFRKQAKFFDVVTYTGDGTTNQTIPHNLGSTPGCIITKRTDSTGNWATWHTSFADTKTYMYLNTTDASVNVPGATAMTVSSTSFTVGSNQIFGNGSGFTYVAYIFAHNASGFGLTGTDNIISCGSYTGSSGSGQSINLGYQPQWLLVKNTSRAGQNWVLMDKYRNFDNTGYGWLYPNSDAAEDSGTGTVYVYPTSTGFTTVTSNAATDYLTDSYIYIAIKDNS